jgi:Asp-tRNA(Asn)/Glu-tRNA(Gln) amidotransferase A subunit family amidase
MKDLASLTAAEAAAGILRGDFSSEALVRACLARIEARDGLVEAWAHLDPDHALRQARAADAHRRAGKTLGALHGVPIGIKDIIDTADLPTENGTPIFAGRQPDADAWVVSRLKAAGAVILGKTVTTELAFFGPGKTRNPADPARTPGGSSSGSAAAVADRHVPLALGTQTAGSILRPASYCGCIGWKPTFGLVSVRGVLAQSPPLDTIGAFARSVEDIALVTDCMSAGDPQESATRARLAAPLVSALDSGPAFPPRLAFVRSPAWGEGDPEMHAAMLGLASRLGPSRISEVDLPGGFAEGLKAQRTLQFRDIARNYGPVADANPGRISAKLSEVIAEGRAVSDAAYAAALALREPLCDELTSLTEGCDAILTPASAGPAPRGLGSTGSPAFNALWTYLGVPAISLPLLELNGLPLGVQLVGRRLQEGRLLNAARWLGDHLAAAGLAADAR